MPGYRNTKKWIYTDTVGKFQHPKSNRAFSKLKAAFRGRKERSKWYAGARGTLHGGRFKRKY